VVVEVARAKLNLFPIGEALGRMSKWSAVTVLKRIDVLKFVGITLLAAQM
jgi:hypothetical protein